MTAKKKAGKGLPLPMYVYARASAGASRSHFRNAYFDEVQLASEECIAPSLWLVQKGRKRASFTNFKAARAFAGKNGKVRAFVEVQA